MPASFLTFLLTMGDYMNDFPEFDDLPDDPEVAFVRLYERNNKEYQELVRSTQDSRAACIDFMNTMLGIARGLDIEGFDAWEVPDDWDDIHPTFLKFDRALTRYVMEIKIRKSRVTKVYSVALGHDDKERIHALVAQIREVISTADLEERKRNSLLLKLAAFEVDVDRSRTRFDNAMLMALDVVGLVDKAGNTINPLNELLRRIEAIMGRAKGEEPEQHQLPGPSERKRLEPPPKRIEDHSDRNLDDDIPF